MKRRGPRRARQWWPNRTAARQSVSDAGTEAEYCERRGGLRKAPPPRRRRNHTQNRGTTIPSKGCVTLHHQSIRRGECNRPPTKLSPCGGRRARALPRTPAGKGSREGKGRRALQGMFNAAAAAVDNRYRMKSVGTWEVQLRARRARRCGSR